MPAPAPSPCASARRLTGVTRLAPSPTGSLHLGNARTFLVNWALARNLGWRIVFRIEDLDGPRIRPEAVAGIAETLRWLGIDWDEGPHVQSADLEPYRAAVRSLVAAGHAYPSDLSRKEIEAATSAPQDGSGERRFPPFLRPSSWDRAFTDTATNWRFLCPEGLVHFADRFKGPQGIDPAAIIGDFIVWTKRAVPAYQLAVVVDDARQGVTEVVRGDDLLDSAARQLLLYRALRLHPEPAYTHLPLVIGPDGKRLAKRHGDSRVDAYREAGVPSAAVIGLLASWSGVAREPQPMSAEDFRRGFTLAGLPADRIVFTPEHDRWLLSHARRPS